MTLGDHTVDGPISCVFLKNQTNIARIANAVQCQKGHYKHKESLLRTVVLNYQKCNQFSQGVTSCRGHKSLGVGLPFEGVL